MPLTATYTGPNASLPLAICEPPLDLPKGVAVEVAPGLKETLEAMPDVTVAETPDAPTKKTKAEA